MRPYGYVGSGYMQGTAPQCAGQLRCAFCGFAHLELLEEAFNKVTLFVAAIVTTE